MGRPRRPTIVENDITLYQCGTCKQYFPYNEFGKLSRIPLGIGSVCKACAREYNKRYCAKGQLWKNRPTKEEHGFILYQCCSCKCFLAVESYHKDKKTAQGIAKQCKLCHYNAVRKSAGYSKNYVRRQPPKEENGITLYHCSKCDKHLPKDAFHKSKNSKYGITHYCMLCIAGRRNASKENESKEQK
jgi:hypothetical protein